MPASIGNVKSDGVQNRSPPSPVPIVLSHFPPPLKPAAVLTILSPPLARSPRCRLASVHSHRVTSGNLQGDVRYSSRTSTILEEVKSEEGYAHTSLAPSIFHLSSPTVANGGLMVLRPPFVVPRCMLHNSCHPGSCVGPARGTSEHTRISTEESRALGPRSSLWLARWPGAAADTGRSCEVGCYGGRRLQVFGDMGCTSHRDDVIALQARGLCMRTCPSYCSDTAAGMT